MAKVTDKSSNMTSFYGTTIKASVNQIIEAVGEPDCVCNDGSGKCNYDWVCETEDGKVFTIYDWKEYRPIEDDEIIDFHVGGFDEATTIQGASEVVNQIKSL